MNQRDQDVTIPVGSAKLLFNQMGFSVDMLRDEPRPGCVSGGSAKGFAANLRGPLVRGQFEGPDMYCQHSNGSQFSIQQTATMDFEDQPSSKKRRRHGERVRGKQDCTFMSDYNRGRAPSIQNAGTTGVPASPETTPPQQEESVLSAIVDVNDQEHQTSPVGPRDRVHTSLAGSAPICELITPETRAPSYIRDHGRSSRNSPEPAHTDQEGHYVGPASGVSFLSRALKKLHQTSHSASTAQQTSVFNFADAPVPQYDPYFLILPSQGEAEALIRRYFDFASPTHRYLHQPTVERWCEEFYTSIRNPGPLAPATHEIRAIILAVLAVAVQYKPGQESTTHDTVHRSVHPGVGRDALTHDLSSAAFFAASEHHLRLGSGGIRLTSIQARLVQCYYLLSQSRVNSAWGLFGTVANLVLAIGLHRRKKRDPIFDMDLIEHECGKRVFWSAYTLDSYLSAGLGRPRSFHEEDLDQEFPLCVDDWQITSMKILPRHEAGQSFTQASIYHARLSKLISGILRDLYGIRRLVNEKQEAVVQLYDARLLQWREELATFLDISKTEIMMTIFRRQHSVLHMAYAHATILLHRQALLVKPSAATARQENAVETSSQYSVRRCLNAAATIVTKLRELVQKQQMYSAFWFTHYYVFSALVALYLYVVQSRSKPSHLWKPYLDLAQQGLRDLAACSTETSYAQRYVVVLTELQNEAMKPTEEESRQPASTHGVQPVYGQTSAAPVSTSGVDLHMDAIASSVADGAVSSSHRLNAIVDKLDVNVHQDPSFASQHDTYGSAGDPCALQDLENAEVFCNLNIEGLADLAFIFSTEGTNAF